MILVDASYINNSGGKVLLEYFIEYLAEQKLINHFYFILDSRLETSAIGHIKIENKTILIGNEKNRKSFYLTQPFTFTSVLCFANVPPPIPIAHSKVFIFFHNTLLLDTKNTKYGIKTKLIFLLKKLYIKFKLKKNYVWLVQTKSMRNLLAKQLELKDDRIKILPIFNVDLFKALENQVRTSHNDFLYVADGVAQKNHLKLLAAWEILSLKYQDKPVLHLTVHSAYQELINVIDQLIAKGIKIINHGLCTKVELSLLYGKCKYFINGSLTESFGLPLIEAAAAGCEVISADLIYVYDVIVPSATFNPYDEKDIAACVNKVLKTDKLSKTKLIVDNKIEDLIKLLFKNV